MDKFQERKSVVDKPRQSFVVPHDDNVEARAEHLDQRSPKPNHRGQTKVRPLHPSQDYKKLRDKLRSSGRLFEDDKFPADNRLLTDNAAGGNIVHYFGGNRVRASEIEWLRPKVRV